MKTDKNRPAAPAFNGTWEFVTPETAAEWLLDHNKNNRKIRATRVTAYARDMRSGDWMATHEAIAFNCDGTLIDGQHRLEAVIESGIPGWFLVFHGVPKAVARVIDSNATRSASDALKIVHGKDATARDVTVAKIIYRGGRNKMYAPTRSEALEMYSKYESAVNTVSSMFEGPSTHIAISPVMGVIGRALLSGVSETKLRKFASVLVSGVSEEPKDAWIVKLRDRLLAPQRTGNHRHRATIYDVTAFALRAWLDGKLPVLLTPASKELFPIPDSDGMPSVPVQKKSRPRTKSNVRKTKAAA